MVTWYITCWSYVVMWLARSTRTMALRPIMVYCYMNRLTTLLDSWSSVSYGCRQPGWFVGITCGRFRSMEYLLGLTRHTRNNHNPWSIFHFDKMGFLSIILKKTKKTAQHLQHYMGFAYRLCTTDYGIRAMWIAGILVSSPLAIILENRIMRYRKDSYRGPKITK